MISLSLVGLLESSGLDIHFRRVGLLVSVLMELTNSNGEQQTKVVRGASYQASCEGKEIIY